MKDSSKRWRSLLVSGLRRCELEVMEDVSHTVVWRFTIIGDLLSYSKKKKNLEDVSQPPLVILHYPNHAGKKIQFTKLEIN